MTLNYDIVVIGGGHAGCEAAHAAARLGARTCLITMDMNKIAQMSCNPAIGGIAKGQIVREADALGGQTAIVTDDTAIQFRMLNKSKGAAVWSPRAQCDRGKFIWRWREALDTQAGLDIWQDQADSLLTDGRRVTGVHTIWGHTVHCRCAVITAGTFLSGLMHIGRSKVAGGRIAEPAAYGLTESLTALGIRSGRMKTGTPVRIDSRSVHFEDMERQDGDADFHTFSYLSRPRQLPQLPCWTCWTNPQTHATLRSALPDSPLYNGQIQSVGPRYCPSIETKLTVFPERERHPLFLEPEGTDTNEMYLNGFSSSLPADAQLAALRQIPALRDVKIYRPGYAIEYDYFDPTQLHHSLESKLCDGLFLAGQVNGTTGYEEAAGQGLIAGANAALKAAGSAPLTLKRDEAYIGVLIDDLTTCGVDEPYRMFTSRAEYRILLRQDDADARLTPLAYNLGLASRQRYDHYLTKQEAADALENYCRQTPVKPAEVNPLLERLGTTPAAETAKVADFIARPQVTIAALSEVLPGLREALNRPADRREEIAEAVETRIKYAGYIARERVAAEKMRRLEDIKIRGRFQYSDLHQLSTEARQKLTAIDPDTLAQASRIPGVSPNDVQVLLVLLGR